MEGSPSSSRPTPSRSWEQWRTNRQKELTSENQTENSEGVGGNPPPPPPPPGPPPASSRKLTPSTADLRNSLLQRTNMARSSPLGSTKPHSNTPNIVVDLTKDPEGKATQRANGRPNADTDSDNDDWDVGEDLRQPARNVDIEESKFSKILSSPPAHPPPPPRERLPHGQPTIVDRAMELAVSNLAQVIRERGSDAVLDDAGDTRRFLDDISAQVSRLMKQEQQRHTVEAGQDAFDVDAQDRDEGEETESRKSREGRPTPYDLWSKRSTVAKDTPSGPKTIKISKERWDGLVERLYASLKQHDIHVAATQRAIIAKELADATFTPKINQRSRQLASTTELSIAERTARLEAQKAQKIQQERQRLSEKELQEATFRPKINEVSKNLASGSGSKLYENPFERREAAARKASMEREAAERAQFTFSPMINPKSREIAVRGKALQMAYSPAKTEPSPHRSSEESFKPAINPYSRKLAGSRDSPGKPIFERLYEDAKETRKPLEKLVTKREKPRSNSSVVVFRPGMEFIVETLQREI